MTTNDADLYTRLGRIEAKLDMILPSTADHNSRLARLENWQAKVVGIAGGVSLLVSLAAKFIIS